MPPQDEHSQNIAAERYLSQQWNEPRNQIRQRLHDVANIMAKLRGEQQNQQPPANSAPAPFPKPAEIQTDSRQFDPKPLTLGIDSSDQSNTTPSNPQGGPTTGVENTPYLMDNTAGSGLATDVWTGPTLTNDSVILEVVVRFDAVNSRYVFRRISFNSIGQLFEISAEGT